MGGLGSLAVGNRLFQRYRYQKYINDQMNRSLTDEQSDNNI